MVDFRYLQIGITGLAQSHHAGTMAGHLGAAVVAGYFFGEDQSDLPKGVYRGIEKELDRVIAGEESIWWNVKKTGISAEKMFQPLPGDSTPEGLTPLADSLAKSIGQLRQSGHNVIFAALALRAIQGHGVYASHTVVDGIQKLIAAFEASTSGRGYYGKKRGWHTGEDVELPAFSEIPPYKSIAGMVQVTLQELIESSNLHKQGFGGLWHLINHAAAIVELDRLGWTDLAKKALPAHHHHLRLWRSLPDLTDELGPVVRAKLHPHDPAYWQGTLRRDDARLTHRIKTIYGYNILIKTGLSKKLQEQADRAFLDLMD